MQTATELIKAFRKLNEKDKELVVTELLKEKEFIEDLIDIAIIESRKDEPSRPFEEYLAESDDN